MARHSGKVLVLAIHRGEKWWAPQHLGFEEAIVVTDRPGRGDRDIVADLRRAYKLHSRSSDRLRLFDDQEINDIIARCRVLRWLPLARATALALGAADAFSIVLDEEQPSIVTSWPIDCYLGDILGRLSERRGLSFVELTAGAVPGTAMVMRRGRLLSRDEPPDDTTVSKALAQVADPLFLPSYVPASRSYSLARFLKTYSVQRIRGWAFKGLSIVERDPLNAHYLDGQSWLGHKPRLHDRRILGLVDRNWRDRTLAVERERRLFIALQMIPEASIDYWIEDPTLLDHDGIIVEVAQAFGAAGYTIFVKDHPLQFGFRQIRLIERLLALPNVVFVPYEVAGTEMLSLCGVNFTLTGTLGLQAGLLGIPSIVLDGAYYYSETDFVGLRDRREIPGLPARISKISPPESLAERQRRIVSKILQGSFAGDVTWLPKMDPDTPEPRVMAMFARFGDELARVSGGKVAKRSQA